MENRTLEQKIGSLQDQLKELRSQNAAMTKEIDRVRQTVTQQKVKEEEECKRYSPITDLSNVPKSTPQQLQFKGNTIKNVCQNPCTLNLWIGNAMSEV